MKRYLFFIYIFMALLLVFPYECTQGAKNGLLLWFNTMIPSVFPFILITGLLRSLGGIQLIEKCFGPIISRIFKCSASSAYAVIIGFLCGYPLGSKAIADIYEQGLVSRSEADFLMTFCNNPSPVFMINFVAINTLNRPDFVLPYLIITYSASIFTAWIFSLIYRKIEPHPKTRQQKTAMSQSKTQLLDHCITDALVTIQKIGVFMILFSIINSLIFLLPNQWDFLKIILCGFIEQTTGIHLLTHGNLSEHTKTTLAALFTSFGGFAVAAQIKGVTGSQRLSLKPYFYGKITQTVITALLMVLFMY